MNCRVGQEEASLQSASTLRGGCLSREWVAKVAQQEAMRQSAGANKKQTGGERWRWRIKRQGRAKMISGRGNATNTRTRDMGGHGETRGNGMMRVGDTGRWKSAV